MRPSLGALAPQELLDLLDELGRRGQIAHRLGPRDLVFGLARLELGHVARDLRILGDDLGQILVELTAGLLEVGEISARAEQGEHAAHEMSGLKSPALWGTKAHIAELFGAQAADIRAVRRNFTFRYHSAAHWLQIFRDFYGPTHKAFAALDPVRQAALAQDITALLDRLNTAGPASLVVPSEYLEVVVTKR